MNNGDVMEMLGYYAPNDGGGGSFYWENGGTGNNYSMEVEVPGFGQWLRSYEGLIDIKWFGAHPNQLAATNTTSITAAFKHASDNLCNLFLSKGHYLIDDITLSIPSGGGMQIYGDAEGITTLIYIGQGTALSLDGSYNKKLILRDFEITGQYQGNGLKMNKLDAIDVENIHLTNLKTGLLLYNVLVSSFSNLHFYGCVDGLYGEEDSNVNPPYHASPVNEVIFTSCTFGAIRYKSVELLRSHSITFESCTFEENGHYITNQSYSCIELLYDGSKGANGLNVTDCYFESNKGLADVKIQCNGKGTHTFTGNTFNRGDAVIYTTHNILIDGNGQSPQPNYGSSKAKLVFQGNGFLSANSYVPTLTQKAIELLNTNPDYWQYDIVEQGNSYTNDLTKPIFPRITPQISEYNRLKAYGRANSEGQNLPEQLYNILSITRAGVGQYVVVYANPLEYLPSVVVTPLFIQSTVTPTFAMVSGGGNNSFILHIFDITGAPKDEAFSFVVF